MLETISSFVLPIVILLVVFAGVFKKVNIFEAFIVGAEKSLRSLFKVVPSLIALTLAVKLLRGSGVLKAITGLLAPLLSIVGLPAEIMPLALLRPISGSGSTALLADMFETYGPDSKIGLMASVLCCSSETTFYTVAMYYGSCGIKNTRHTIVAALAADVTAVIFSVLFVNLFFSL